MSLLLVAMTCRAQVGCYAAWYASGSWRAAALPLAAASNHQPQAATCAVAFKHSAASATAVQRQHAWHTRTPVALNASPNAQQHVGVIDQAASPDDLAASAMVRAQLAQHIVLGCPCVASAKARLTQICAAMCVKLRLPTPPLSHLLSRRYALKAA
jgi:hypothetical protein